MEKISVVIHTKNAEATIERALKSVQWCDDVVVIDMQSTDKTRDIARKYGARVAEVEDVGFADPYRNFGLQQTKHEWVLVLDADEEVPPSLAEKLQELTKKDADVWKMPRKNIIFGKWMKHTGWWPDYQIHFFKKSHVSWSEAVHTHPQTTGKVEEIPATEDWAKVHYNYENVKDYLERMNRYTTIQAEQSKGQAKPFEFLAGEFGRRYVLDKGYRDGTHGVYISMLQAFYEYTAALKQWENNGYKEEAHPAQIIDRYISDLHYWRADFKVQTAYNPLPKLYWKIRRKLKI